MTAREIRSDQKFQIAKNVRLENTYLRSIHIYFRGNMREFCDEGEKEIP